MEMNLIISQKIHQIIQLFYNQDNKEHLMELINYHIK